MIPHLPNISGQQAHDCFFLVEKPGFNVALIVGSTQEDIPGDGDTTLAGDIHCFTE